MPANPLQPFLQNWQKRLSQAQAAGINPEALRPIFQMDYQRLQQGTTPLNNEQASVAIQAAAGAPPIVNQGPSKPDWNPIHLLGHAVGDIGTIGKGLITLPKAVAHDVTHIGEMPGAIAKGAGEIASGKVGEGLQDIAGAPGLQELLIASDFIPGVDAVTAPITAGVLAAGEAGKALTPQGRKDISQHPLVNFLNVLPGLSEAGVTSKITQAVQESAAGVMANKTLDQLGVSEGYRQAWRLFSDANKDAHNQVGAIFKNAQDMFKTVAPEDMGFVTNALRKGTPEDLAAVEAKYPGFTENVKRPYDALQMQLSQDDHLVHLQNPDTGVTDVFPKGSLPDRSYGVLVDAKNQLALADASLSQATRTVGEARAAADAAQAALPDVQALAKRLEPAMQQEIAHVGTGETRVGPAIEALKKGQYTTAARLLNEAGMKDEAQTVSEIPARQQEYVNAQRRLQDAKATQDRAAKALEPLQKRVTDRTQAFRKALQSKPAARWHPLVSEDFHARVEDWAQKFYSKDPAKLSQVVNEIGHRYDATFEDGTPMIPKAVLTQMQNESTAQIIEWQRKGWDPSFVHSVSESQVRNLRYPHVARRTEPSISSFKERMLNSGKEEVDNVALSLTHQQAEVAVNDLWQKAWNGYTGPDGIKQKGILERYGQTRQQLMDQLRARGLTGDEARAEIDKNWSNPKDHGYINQGPFARNKQLIPKSLATNIDKLQPSLSPMKNVAAVFDKTTRGYRFAVTRLSPQHMVHIIASGAVMLGMTMHDLPGVLSSIGEVRQMMRDGTVPLRFQQEASMLPEEDSLVYAARDKTAARLYKDWAGKGLNPVKRLDAAINRFDTHITQWYKTLDYVSQVKHGLDPEEALGEVAKHFADHAGRAPIERTIFKSYVPFGSWTQHLIQFAFQFPADHPLRAAVLANLATAELADQTSGLPRDFAQLFFMGDKAFDIRSFNPFRDIGTDFTLAGFIAQLNPAAEAVFRAKGYDPIANSAELYPEMAVDPNTGRLVTVGKTSFGQALAEGYLPQVQGIEGLLGWSDTLRNLKKNDPSAYASTLARYLHFPWLPRTVNIPQQKAKDQLATLTVAQQAVSNAMKTGDFSKVNQYNEVPFQGKMVPPRLLQELYQMLQSKNTGFTPNTLLRK